MINVIAHLYAILRHITHGMLAGSDFVFLGDMCSCSLQTMQEPGRTGSTGTSLTLA
jgi:hypothetical protein